MYSINLQHPVTKIAKELYKLHIMMLIICFIIFIAVFGIMFFIIISYKKSKNTKKTNNNENILIEIIWTIIPLIIIILMAWPATKIIIMMKNTENSDLTIKVTGYQWKWGYSYIKGAGEGINFFSTMITPNSEINNKQKITNNYLQSVDNPLVVPIHKKIRIITTSSDVIHSWYVPAFGVKQDAIPGFIRDTWFEVDDVGTYHGFCTELCGKGHSYMPIVVKVLNEKDYLNWVNKNNKNISSTNNIINNNDNNIIDNKINTNNNISNTSSNNSKIYNMNELMEYGKKTYLKYCSGCHKESGEGSGIFPALNKSSIVNNNINDHIKIILYGKNSMPSWINTLTNLDIASVTTYERNSWNNHTGDIVQPNFIEGLKKK